MMVLFFYKIFFVNPHIIYRIPVSRGTFMDALLRFVSTFQEYLWSFPMLVLLGGTHLYFTVKLRFIQRKIPLGIRLSLGIDKTETRQKSQDQLYTHSQLQKQKDMISPYEALATALAATIGTGNIVGISTAIALGGPGAVLWCWLTGVFGIATCYAECFLAVKYRTKDEAGNFIGGPMYVLERGLGKRGLAVAFALFAVLASFGIGSSVQSHSISTAIRGLVPVSPHVIGIAAGVLAGLVIVGGRQKIAGVCTWLVPVMSLLYLGGCLWILGKNRVVLPETFAVIFKDAFSPQAFVGGVAGRTIMTCMRTGISRGLFTNEAGLGSIPMAAASAKTDSAVRQGLISMTGPFWDTVVMCAITGVAAVSSMVADPARYIGIHADDICMVAFGELPFGGATVLSVSLVLFAFATIIGWNVYGTSAVRYLWGEKAVKAYQVVYMLFVYLGAVLSLDLVWGLSDLFNSFMAIPNLLCLWMLRKTIELPDRN